jgi:alpha-ribazole phosphatase/probable phosphoglycerate mutase
VTRLILIRHADPADEARGRCYGSLDVGLSAAGAARADRLAVGLASVPLAAIYTSPRLRAVRTAEAIAAPRGLEPVTEDGMRELDFGRLEGRTYEEIAASHPELYRRWMETPTEVAFPGGESYAELRVRVLRAVAEIRLRHPDGAAAVVSHGGPLRVLLAEALAMPAATIFRIEQAYGAVNVIEWIDGFPLVRLVNGSAADL